MNRHLLGPSTGGQANLGLVPGPVCECGEEECPQLLQLGDGHLEWRRKPEPICIGLPGLRGRFGDEVRLLSATVAAELQILLCDVQRRNSTEGQNISSLSTRTAIY